MSIKLNNKVYRNTQEQVLKNAEDIEDIKENGLPLGDGTVTTPKIAEGAVSNSKIADGSVTTAKLADLAVTTGKVADQAITASKLADLNVSQDKLADNSVSTAKIVDSNVTTAKVANYAITNIKLANNAVDNEKILDGAVTTNKIMPLNVTNDKLANNALTFNKFNKDDLYVFDYSSGINQTILDNANAAKVAIMMYNGKPYQFYGTNGGNPENYYTFIRMGVFTNTVDVIIFDISDLTYPTIQTKTIAQAILESGTNIKTINGSSILGSGDLTVGGGGGYLHCITACLYTSASEYVNAMFTIKSDSSTAMNLSAVYTWLSNNGYNSSANYMACYGFRNAATTFIKGVYGWSATAIGFVNEGSGYGIINNIHIYDNVIAL